jgi:hypothetical protein
MRIRFIVLGLLGLLLAFCGNGSAQKVPASPLELRISGPGLIRTGQTLLFKVTLINHSSAPIAISMREPGTSLSTFFWRITNSSGKENPTPEPRLFWCPVTGVPLSPSDSDIIVLRPGEHFDVKKPGDPSDDFVFPGKGLYFVTFSYRFTAYSYRFTAWTQDEKDDKIHIRFAGLSPKNVELLKNTPDLNVISNAWPMRYE